MSSKPTPTRRQVKAFVNALIAQADAKAEAELIAEGNKWSNQPTLADFGITQEGVVSAEKDRQEAEERVKRWYRAVWLLALAIYLLPALGIVAGFFNENMQEAVQKYGRAPSDAFLGIAILTVLATPFITFKWAAIAALLGSVAAIVILANEDRIKGGRNTTLAQHEKYRRACKAFDAAQERRKRDFWISLNGHAFEHEVANLLRRVGHKAKVTRGSGDDGIDIICEIDGESVVFQCKRYSGSVGPALVREFYGSLMHHGADRGVIATTGGYTQGAIDFAEDKPIDLWTLDEILALQQADGQSGRR
jgi:hypothetical protein